MQTNNIPLIEKFTEYLSHIFIIEQDASTKNTLLLRLLSTNLIKSNADIKLIITNLFMHFNDELHSNLEGHHSEQTHAVIENALLNHIKTSIIGQIALHHYDHAYFYLIKFCKLIEPSVNTQGIPDTTESDHLDYFSSTKNIPSYLKLTALISIYEFLNESIDESERDQIRSIFINIEKEQQYLSAKLSLQSKLDSQSSDLNELKKLQKEIFSYPETNSTTSPKIAVAIKISQLIATTITQSDKTQLLNDLLNDNYFIAGQLLEPAAKLHDLNLITTYSILLNDLSNSYHDLTMPVFTIDQALYEKLPECIRTIIRSKNPDITDPGEANQRNRNNFGFSTVGHNEARNTKLYNP